MRPFRIVLTAITLLLGTAFAHAEHVMISIDKISQKMAVSLDGQLEYVWPVSTAAAGYTTPSGTFHPFRMEEDHFSDEWDDAPMPHSIFFTPAGHAIHGSEHVKSLGRPASHGCVRLDPANAAILYALVEEAGIANTIVVVKGGGIKSVSGEREPASLTGISEPARFQPGALY
jgi:lipoprotein-anchoring transpeptidase ErfK/SrfK